jgi:hypothetical protein
MSERGAVARWRPAINAAVCATGGCAFLISDQAVPFGGVQCEAKEKGFSRGCSNQTQYQRPGLLATLLLMLCAEWFDYQLPFPQFIGDMACMPPPPPSARNGLAWGALHRQGAQSNCKHQRSTLGSAQQEPRRCSGRGGSGGGEGSSSSSSSSLGHAPKAQCARRDNPQNSSRGYPIRK